MSNADTSLQSVSGRNPMLCSRPERSVAIFILVTLHDSDPLGSATLQIQVDDKLADLRVTALDYLNDGDACELLLAMLVEGDHPP
jgi:hypothetical protein